MGAEQVQQERRQVQIQRLSWKEKSLESDVEVAEGVGKHC